jgi:hypothetical protein
MGIYESLNRSAGSIDAIANILERKRKQKQLESNTARLRSLLMGGGQDNTAIEPESITTPAVAPTAMQPVSIPATSVPNIAQSLERARSAQQTADKSGRNGGMRGLGDMNADEILGMGSILRESPELTPQVELLQKAYAARQPEEFNLNQGEGRYRRDRNTNQVTPLVVNPSKATPQKQEEGDYIRNGVFVHDVFQPGDLPYEKPAREPQPNLETIRHNKATEGLASEKEKTDLRLKGQTRVKELTDKNKDLSSQMALLQQTKDKDGNPMYTPEVINGILQNIKDNQDEIARIHLKHGGKFITLKVAREYYKKIDPNAPELKLDDAQLKSELEKHEYEVGK